MGISPAASLDPEPRRLRFIRRLTPRLKDVTYPLPPLNRFLEELHDLKVATDLSSGEAENPSRSKPTPYGSLGINFPRATPDHLTRVILPYPPSDDYPYSRLREGPDPLTLMAEREFYYFLFCRLHHEGVLIKIFFPLFLSSRRWRTFRAQKTSRH